MKTDSEKEKKLSFALNKLKGLDLQNPTLKTNLEILRSSTDAKGRVLEVRTIQKPADEKLGDVFLSKSYINFYIANGGIIMPMYGDEKADHDAYEKIQSCFPERKVMQIDCREIVTGGGNIHCITQQEPKVISAI